MNYNLTYKCFGNLAILIEWPAEIDEHILEDILNFKDLLLKYFVKQKVEIVSSYNTLLIIYSQTIDNIYSELSFLKESYLNVQNEILRSSYCWQIPVCYDDVFALDLEELSAEKKLSKWEIIKRHHHQKYTVFFIGFLPGFLYLGGLEKSLHTNRKSSPNLNTKKGAVGIGGKQTGIYPQNSPGGWYVIGNSPINFFDVKKENPCFAKPGDKVEFIPISSTEYYDIKRQVEDGTYELKYTDL